MDANMAKRLDEACNRYNDRFGDEALYLPWVELPPGASAADRAASAGLRAFMARLSASLRDSS